MSETYEKFNDTEVRVTTTVTTVRSLKSFILQKQAMQAHMTGMESKVKDLDAVIAMFKDETSPPGPVVTPSESIEAIDT